MKTRRFLIGQEVEIDGAQRARIVSDHGGPTVSIRPYVEREDGRPVLDVRDEAVIYGVDRLRVTPWEA